MCAYMVRLPSPLPHLLFFSYFSNPPPFSPPSAHSLAPFSNPHSIPVSRLLERAETSTNR